MVHERAKTDDQFTKVKSDLDVVVADNKRLLTLNEELMATNKRQGEEIKQKDAALAARNAELASLGEQLAKLGQDALVVAQRLQKARDERKGDRDEIDRHLASIRLLSTELQACKSDLQAHVNTLVRLREINVDVADAMAHLHEGHTVEARDILEQFGEHKTAGAAAAAAAKQQQQDQPVSFCAALKQAWRALSFWQKVLAVGAGVVAAAGVVLLTGGAAAFVGAGAALVGGVSASSAGGAGVVSAAIALGDGTKNRMKGYQLAA